MQHMGYFIVVRHVECVFNTDYIARASCDVVPPRNRSVNAELLLLQRIRHIMGTLQVSIPKGKKKNLHKIFEITFELCKVLRERKRKTLIEILNSMSCMANATVLCPINEGTYRAKNITIVEALPPVLDESDFLINFNWFMPRAANVMNITVLGRLYDVAKERSRKRKYL
ncbi:hypothetical protein KR222_006617 [Zaprionus bogoriensis]|nr:hypothetical protein KR222_006617 [Zaprionus bogoriensis]